MRGVHDVHSPHFCLLASLLAERITSQVLRTGTHPGTSSGERGDAFQETWFGVSIDLPVRGGSCAMKGPPSLIRGCGPAVTLLRRRAPLLKRHPQSLYTVTPLLRNCTGIHPIIPRKFPTLWLIGAM
eukprot:CAMPEP_0173236514 /NCGR_PEP_ID=MMETSP1142-20121109/11486_1 /TAXON_ID=483371 /ORGANISM="non described non described, Strain CCMP2298" /LENGTH=126 /DNA_ID=CAMNT_0014166999 /DNA_START=189 /DNA_END=569 /DNA_ORIENTATION=-